MKWWQSCWSVAVSWLGARCRTGYVGGNKHMSFCSCLMWGELIDDLKNFGIFMWILHLFIYESAVLWIIYTIKSTLSACCRNKCNTLCSCSPCGMCLPRLHRLCTILQSLSLFFLPPHLACVSSLSCFLPEAHPLSMSVTRSPSFRVSVWPRWFLSGSWESPLEGLSQCRPISFFVFFFQTPLRCKPIDLKLAHVVIFMSVTELCSCIFFSPGWFCFYF